MKSLLIIEDDLDLIHQLKLAAEDQFKVLTASKIQEAGKIIKNEPLDGIVVDYYLPDGVAKDLLLNLPSSSRGTKFLIMTAHAQKCMAIECLNLGVHGFIEKPFSKKNFLEFLNSHFPTESWLPVLSIELCPRMRTAKIKDRVYSLTDTEFYILDHFMRNENKWISRNQIISDLWGASSISRNAFDTHLFNLKNKVPFLKDAITNLRGRGYIFDQQKIP